MKDYKAILEPEGIYHIYNRSNGNERLFVGEGHYEFFLQKYRHHISPMTETLCYCLMPNHFHFLVRMKTERELISFFQKEKGGEREENKRKVGKDGAGGDLTGFGNLSGLISRQFSNFFNSYTKAYNKEQDRSGNLFERPFKRKRIENEQYLRKLIHYIHYNPVEAGLCQKPENWRFSSYQAILSNTGTGIQRKEVLELFEDEANFIHCHQQPFLQT